MAHTVILFHSVLGLRPAESSISELFRRAGHTVIVPDLFGGRTAATVDQGFELADRVGWDAITGRAREAVRNLPEDALLAGISMGASVVEALLPSRPKASGVLLLHGLCGLPTTLRSGLPIQLNLADPDCYFPSHRVAAWEETARSVGADAEVHRYPGAGHYYTDATLPDHDAPAAELTRSRCVEFLQRL